MTPATQQTGVAVATPKRIVIKLPEVRQEIEISPAWIAERDAITAQSASVTAITTQEGFEAASQLLSKVTKISNALEEQRTKLSRPFNEAAKLIKAGADHAREPLEAEKSRLKRLLGAYAEEQRRAQEEERRRIEEEQRRQIEEQAAQRQAQEELGVADEATVFAPVVSTPEPVVVAARSSSARVVERVAWSLLDEDKVPRGFMVLDERKVSQHAREQKDMIMRLVKDGQGEQIVPGIKFVIETDVAAR